MFGVGGAGGNAVNNMIASKLEGVEFVVANTDAQALAPVQSRAPIQLGSKHHARPRRRIASRGRPRGGGGKQRRDHDAARSGSHMVFITAGMGGGTGTGAAPVIARLAREHGHPDRRRGDQAVPFEGQRRMRIAEEASRSCRSIVDTLIVIPNQNLFRVANEKTTFADAFEMADEVLYCGVRGVTDLMVMPGLINLDFADVRTVMSEMGKAMMGTGEAEGERARDRSGRSGDLQSAARRRRR